MATIPNNESQRFCDPFTHAVGECATFFSCSRQTACHILREKSFKMGTDRAMWVIPEHCRELIEAENAQQVAA